MQAVDVLVTEHSLILTVLDALDLMADRAEAGAAFEPEDAALAVKFFRGFTDACHHSKEEAHLFPALAPYGLTPDRGPVAVMLAEHQEGRADVKALDAAITALAADEPGAGERFAQAARAYTKLLRSHIGKENEVLFPLANRMFSQAEQDTLLAAFDKVEEEEMGAGVHEEFASIVDTLAERYGLEAVAHDHGHGTGGSCGHHG